jgi:hypothetical protein
MNRSVDPRLLERALGLAGDPSQPDVRQAHVSEEGLLAVTLAGGGVPETTVLLQPAGTAAAYRRLERISLSYSGARLAPAAARWLEGYLRDHQSLCFEDLLVLATPIERGDPARDADELDLHLSLVPYLWLPERFEVEPCLLEAQAERDRFILERQRGLPAGETGRWHSLALRNRGGVDGSPIYADDEADPSQPYAWTPTAGRCPAIVALLERALDIERCAGVHILVLEAGGRIVPHSDSPEQTLVRSFNLALSMPEDCHFHIGCRDDGSSAPWTRRLAFEAGMAAILNVAAYHRVENRSHLPRFHLVARSPVQMPTARLLQCARRQNDLASAADLVAAVRQRQKVLGRPVASRALLKRLSG